MNDGYNNLVTERDNARLERDHYKGIITKLRKDIKPLMQRLQFDANLFSNPSWTPRPDDGDRAKLFGILDMFNLQASGLPDADALKRVQRWRDEQVITARLQKVRD